MVFPKTVKYSPTLEKFFSLGNFLLSRLCFSKFIALCPNN